jgi:hypothetical protein
LLNACVEPNLAIVGSNGLSSKQEISQKVCEDANVAIGGDNDGLGGL